MMRPTFAVLAPLTLATLLTPAAAQSATIAPFGTGCSFAGQTLTIGAQGLPQLGSTVTLTYSGPNQVQQLGVQPMLALGVTTAAIPIPAGILPTQPTNCFQWIDPLVLLPMPQNGGVYQDQVPVGIPNQTTLLGFQFTAQWLGLAVQCGFVLPCTLTALPTSDALVLTVGT